MDEASKYNEWLFAPKTSEKVAADKMYALLRKRQLTAAMRKTLDAELEEIKKFEQRYAAWRWEKARARTS